MKILFKFPPVLLIVFAGLLQTCKKDQVPSLTTAQVTNITGTTATGGGEVTDEGSGIIIEQGICWSTDVTPVIDNERAILGGPAGEFICEMSGLEGATTYYVRSYATNAAGTGYGAVVSFKTLGQTPSSLTQAATNIATNSATLNGVVIANYLATTVSFEYGTSTNYGQTATPSQNTVTGNEITGVTVDLSGLTEGTTYHFRVKTVNSIGTTFGNDLTFTTLGQAPAATTIAACCLSATGGRLNGTVNANWLPTVVTFEYGLTMSYGNTTTAYQSPLSGNSPTSVNSGIAGLTPSTEYHFRVKAVNSLGTTYGEDKFFTTLPSL